MSNDRGKLKKYITQYMINKGSTSTKNLFDYCQKICPGTHLGAYSKKTGLNTFFTDVGGSIEELIKEINSNISEQSFLIEFATCEVTNQKLVIWCNKKNDDISRSQKHFSPLKLEYFQAILLEMLNSTTCYINYVNAINISSTLTRRLTLYDAEIILMEWIRIGYFVKKSEDLYLGVRTITEFQPYLNKNPNKSNCELCNELVFTVI